MKNKKNRVNVREAIKAKLRDKSNMPKWYEKRLAFCVPCIHNTANIDNLSIKDKLRTAHNLGKDACNICSCGIEDKASTPTESCPLEQPKWTAVQMPDKTNKLGVVQNLSPSKVDMYMENGFVVFDYKTIPYDSDGKIEFYWDTKGDNDKKLNLKSGCGCTTPEAKNYQNGYKINIVYDTKRTGKFEKRVVADTGINNVTGGTVKVLNIIIRGIVEMPK